MFVVLDKNCGYGIDLKDMGIKEKKYVRQCFRFESEKPKSAIKYARKLLKIRPESAEYNFWMATFYYDHSIEGYHFPNRNPVSESNYKYHLRKALKIKPNHPIFLEHRGISFWTAKDGRSALSEYKKVKKLLTAPNYLQQYKHSLDIYKFEINFQKRYISACTRVNDYKMLSKTLNEFYPRFIELSNHIDDALYYSVQHTANTYIRWFCHQGRLRKAYQAYLLQNELKNITKITMRNTEIHFILLVSLGKYQKAEKRILYILKNINNISSIKNEQQRRQNIMLLNIFLCYIYAGDNREKGMSQIMNEMNQMMDTLDKFTEKHGDQQFMDALTFLKFAVCHLWLCHMIELNYLASTKEMCEPYMLKLMSTIELALKSDTEIRTSPFLHFLIAKVRLILFLNVDKNVFNGMNGYYSVIQQFIWALLMSIDGGEFEKVKRPYITDPNYYVLKPRITPFVPLSFYYLGVVTMKTKQYQIAVIALKLSQKLGNEIALIQSECGKLLKRAMKKWRQQTCANCGTHSKLKSCSGCGAVAYCSRLCQKLDWKQHATQCTKLWIDMLILERYNVFKHNW